MGGSGVHIAAVCGGRVTDFGITDANNMGAAMAPAAADTIFNFLQDTSTSPDDYDLIVTGDLSSVGGELLCELLSRKGVNLGKNYTDCGLLIYDRNKQDVHAGGSGCGLLGGGAQFVYSQQNGAQGAEQRAVHRHRRPDVSHLLPAGREHPGIAHLVHLVTA